MESDELFNPIDITEEEHQKCCEFSEKYDYSEHNHRKQKDEKKSRLDNCVGKMAEMVAYKSIKKFRETTYPDFNIYDKKDKSWDADLFVTIDGNKVPFHVKGQDVKQGKKYGISWLFQWGNDGVGGGRDKIFDDDATGWVVFVSMDMEKRVGGIEAIVSVERLKEYGIIYEEPTCRKYHGIKKAVYLDSDEHIDIKQFGLDGINGLRKQKGA